MTKEYGDGDGTSEGGEIRHDVIDRSNELLVTTWATAMKTPHANVADRRKLTTIPV